MSIHKDIKHAFQFAYSKEWITKRDGNISILKNNKIHITPSGVDKTSDMNLVQWEDPFNSIQPAGASIETEMHYLVHKQRGRDGCVVHFHPPFTVALMRKLIDSDILPIVAQFPELSRYTKLGSTVSYFDPGSEDLAQSVAKSLVNKDICGMFNHGVTSCADTLDGAIEHIERLEHIAKIVLLS